MEFDIVKTLLNFTTLGATWVLWLLIALSVISIAIIIERAAYYWRLSVDYSKFANELSTGLNDRQFGQAQGLCEKMPSLESQIVLVGLRNREKGREAVEGSMEGYLVGERQKLDRGLVVLGTLGNNAPFIGLFGTVIGIIQAFNDLSLNPEGGPAVVMNGISEALIATAVGLLVAIPAVIAFNAFNRIVKSRIANAQAMIKIVMTYI